MGVDERGVEHFAKDLVETLIGEGGVEDGEGIVSFPCRAIMEESAEEWIRDHSFLFVDEFGDSILN